MPLPPGDWVPPAGNLFGDPEVDVGPLYVPTEYYAVQGVAQIERIRADGKVVPTIETTFVVPGTPGTHSLNIDNYAFTYADPLRDLRGRSKRILRLYALPTVLPPDPEEL